MNHVLAGLVFDVVLFRFVLKHHIQSTSIPLEVDVNRHSDMHLVSLFAAVPTAPCWSSVLHPDSVSLVPRWAVLYVLPVLEAAALFSLVEDVFLLLIAPFSFL